MISFLIYIFGTLIRIQVLDLTVSGPINQDNCWFMWLSVGLLIWLLDMVFLFRPFFQFPVLCGFLDFGMGLFVSFFFFNYYYYDDNKNISCFSLLWYTEMSVEQVDLEDGWAKLKVFICELIARVNAGKQPYFVDEFKTNWTYNALSSSLLLVLFFNFSCLSRWFVLLYV